VEAILFDYGHTLITYRRPEAALRDAYAEIADRLSAAGVERVPAPERLMVDVHDRIESAVTAHEQAEHLEEIDLVAEERRAYADCGMRLNDDLLDEVTHMVQIAWWQGIVVASSVVTVLSALRAAGLRIGLCSNAPYRARSLRGQLHHLGLDRHLDSITFSSEVGWRKPAPQVFTAALGALGAIPDTTIMVGDRRREDVSGARAMGLATVRTREFEDDAGADDADVVIDTLGDLVPLLLGQPHR
jgi:FMN phosphatase YigB (HAD superfamily)